MTNERLYGSPRSIRAEKNYAPCIRALCRLIEGLYAGRCVSFLALGSEVCGGQISRQTSKNINRSVQCEKFVKSVYWATALHSTLICK